MRRNRVDKTCPAGDTRKEEGPMPMRKKKVRQAPEKVCHVIIQDRRERRPCPEEDTIYIMNLLDAIYWVGRFLWFHFKGEGDEME